MSYFRFPVLCCTKQKKKIRNHPDKFDTDIEITQKNTPHIYNTRSRSKILSNLPVLTDDLVGNKSFIVQEPSSMLNLSSISDISKVPFNFDSTSDIINDISLIEHNTNKIKINIEVDKKRNIRMFNNYINSKLEKFKIQRQNPCFGSIKLAQV